MNIDYILTARSVDDMFESIADPDFKERSEHFMRFLGIGDTIGLTLDDKDHPVDRDAVRMLQSRVAAAFSDRSERRAGAIADLLDAAVLWDRDRDATMDMVSAAWVESMGLSPADLYLISSFSQEMYLERRDGALIDRTARLLVISEESDYVGGTPCLEVVHHIAPHCWWTRGQLDIAEDMVPPETVRTASVGRPLRDVFQHPFLDPHDLRITGWEDETTILTDAARVRVFPRKTT